MKRERGEEIFTAKPISWSAFGDWLKNREKNDGKKAGGNSFGKQAETLLASGYAEALGLRRKVFKACLEPLENIFQEGDIIVVPGSVVSIPKLMSLVSYGENWGECHIDLSILRDLEEIPPHALLDSRG